MDPTGVSLGMQSATIGIFDVSQDAYNLLTPITKLNDPRLDEIYRRLLSEKKKSDEWVNQMRAAFGAEPWTSFPDQQYKKTVHLLKKFRQYYVKAGEKFASIAPTQGFLSRQDLQRIRRLLQHGGYDDLDNIVRTLIATNQGLREILEFPPLYSSVVDGRISPTALTLGLVSALNPSGLNLEPTLAPRQQPSSSTVVTAMDEAQNVIKHSGTPSVGTIYRTTLSALATISVRHSSAKIARSHSRLKLWGAGLFEMGVSMDTVFDADRRYNRPLRECILGTLVDILVWEGQCTSFDSSRRSSLKSSLEQELNGCGRDNDNKQRVQDQVMARGITALLGTDELLHIALKSWKTFIEQYEYDEKGPSYRNYNYVPGLVETLFDLVPGLRAARRAYCADLAQAVSQQNVNTDISLNVAANPALSDTRSPEGPNFEEVVRNLDMTVDILTRRDKILVKKKNGPAPFAPVFKEEKARIQKYYLSRKDRKSMDARELEDFQSRQDELLQVLSRWHFTPSSVEEY